MSQALDFAANVHRAQIEAATRGQEELLKAIEQLTELGGKAPVTAPSMPAGTPDLASVFGHPADFLRHSAQSTADWAKLSTQFQNRLAALFEKSADKS